MVLLPGSLPNFVTTPRTVAVLLLIGVFSSCIVPGGEDDFEGVGVIVNLNDPMTRRIYDLQNARQTDSLLYYLGSTNPNYRYLAARAFSSFPELTPLVTDSLASLLKDRYELVRSAAAFSLGQSGREAVATQLAQSFDTLGNMPEYNAAALAAVGKTGSEEYLDHLTKVTTYRPTDTLLQVGRAWGLFNFAFRGLQSAKGDSIMLAHLLDAATPPKALEPVTGYLHRFAIAIDTAAETGLRQILRNSTEPDVLMATARTLGRSKAPSARVALLRALRSATDWRVRTEIIQALKEFPYATIREPIIERLQDPHPLVRRSAADFLLAQGTAADATFYRSLARDSSQTDIRYRLYAAANRHLPLYLTDYRGRINYDLQQAYVKTTDPFQRADILAALAEFPWNYRTIHELYQQAQQAPVRSAAAEALRSISDRTDFVAFFRGSARRVRLDLSVYFREMIYGREVGPAYFAANALAKNAEVYRAYYPDLDWMSTALRGFSLPKEIETYRSVELAQAALAGTEEPPTKAAGAAAKTIDWQRIGADAGDEVVIRVPEGRIILELYPDIAPATVSSFLELVKADYYNGKLFHRVVPNFVAQGGGPRGDGFGSEEFIIRTETPGIRWDRPGLIGMASAGKDTEGVQFFITHRPTPHLNGNYTIFGGVTEGQEVVDMLTMGSIIESIELR
ncbi:MAG: peptidylprolyl isomerase [Bacteroidota bacterium]